MSEPATPHPPAPAATDRLGPFRVEADGALSPIEAAGTPRFGFRWRGRRVAAGMPDGRRLVLSVAAGRVPLTAASGEARRRVLAAIRALHDALPPGWRLRLTADHGVHFETEADLGAPPTASRLLAAATHFVVALDPCLDFLEEAGAGAA